MSIEELVEELKHTELLLKTLQQLIQLNLPNYLKLKIQNLHSKLAHRKELLEKKIEELKSVKKEDLQKLIETLKPFTTHPYDYAEEVKNRISIAEEYLKRYE